MDPIAEIEGAVADATGLIGDVEGAIADVEGGVADAEGALLQFEYLAAIPIIAAEFKGLVDILLGAGETFWGVLQSLGFFIPDFFDGIFTLATFSLSWMMCLFKNIANMQTCLFYYLLEVIGQILYLPVRLFLWIFIWIY
jgi:hypothetical protein